MVTSEVLGASLSACDTRRMRTRPACGCFDHMTPEEWAPILGTKCEHGENGDTVSEPTRVVIALPRTVLYAVSD